MALSTWTPAFQLHQATCSEGTTSQVPPCQQETFLFSMSIWQNDKNTMEGQGRQQKCHEDGHMAQEVCFGGPIGIQLPWPHCPIQGQAYPTTL